MTGIFGYLDLNGIHEHGHSFIHSIEEMGYCITDKDVNHSCVLGKLDLQGSKIKTSIIREDGITVVVCGEIYNENTSNLDIEILKLYKEEQLDLLKNFNGAFAAAIYDESEYMLTLVNDRYGLIKLFYYFNEGIFCFSPKIKPLLMCNPNKTLRKDSIIDFFIFGYLLGNKTFLNGIHQLPPASILRFSKGDLKMIQHWSYEYHEDYEMKSEDKLVEKLGNLWQQSVERRINMNEIILIPLSGGLDSRAILAAALKCTSKDNIITFTYGNPGSFDFEIGRMIAKKVGVRNIALGVEKELFEEQYRLSIDDMEGMIDATPYFAINGYKEIKKYGTNILSGYIGDFVMGSHMYPTMLKKKINNEHDYRSISDLFVKHEKLLDQKLLYKLFCGEFSFSLSEKQIHYGTNKMVANIFFKFFFENHTVNYSYFAVFRDRHLFNYKTPFLDNDLVDFMLNVPPELRYKQNIYRKMLVKEYPELFELPTKNNLGLKLDANKKDIFLVKSSLLLKRIVNRMTNILINKDIYLDKTKNYLNYDTLLREDQEYREYMRKMIEKVEKREYFNNDYIEYLWVSQLSGKNNCSMLLGLLVTFELLMENFIDT